MKKHKVREMASGELGCSCGRIWDADLGEQCPAIAEAEAVPALVVTHTNPNTGKLTAELLRRMADAIEDGRYLRGGIQFEFPDAYTLRLHGDVTVLENT
jgi:hypothetical protein